ncbi:MAG: tetratricopeptide repeat protein [Chromatiales bacterium]|nr:tetratricopeptide repeat protein [Chromatiales bacterium]
MNSVYSTDEEKAEAIREWWKKYGASVTAGVVLGLAGIVGWKFWVDYREGRAETASDTYIALTRAAERDAETVQRQVDQLRQDHARSPYAALGALDLARQKGEAGDFAAAAAELRWVRDNARQDEVRRVATLRLARVLAAMEQYDEALRLLGESFAPTYTALVEELRGDIHRAQGRADEALAAYDRALQATTENNEYLRLKRDELQARGNGR